jgi:hypothetical protein
MYRSMWMVVVRHLQTRTRHWWRLQRSFINVLMSFAGEIVRERKISKYFRPQGILYRHRFGWASVLGGPAPKHPIEESEWTPSSTATNRRPAQRP